MKNKSLILFIICLLLLFIPFAIWGNTYLVGGDDTRLYYVFPFQFLKNYAFNIISDNTLAGAMTGYTSVAYFAPMFFIFWIFKFIPYVSTQLLLYGLNLSLGFLGFYTLINLWIRPKNTKEFSANIIAGIFYVTSIYLVKTMYTNQLLSIYLISVLPWTLYLFFKGVKQKKVVFVLLSVIVFSLFSSTINTLPWWAGIILVLLPLFLYEFLLQKKIFFIYSCVFIALFFLLNFYWIFHFIYPYIHPVGLQSIFQYYSSTNFIKDNIRIITGVAGLFTPLNIPFIQMDSNFANDISLILLPQSIFFACIIAAGLITLRNKEEKTIVYFVVLFSFLLSWFFFSPNIGLYGTNVFLFFGNHIPFFTMFRNMFDKFALPLAFMYAFALAISLQIIFRFIRLKWISTGLIILLAIILLFTSVSNALFLKKQINPLTTFSGEFNSDFMKMVSYLPSLDNASRVAWIPLNAPTYTSVEDGKYPGHFYSGLSPLRELANMSDYAGGFSFITSTDLFLGDRLFTLLDQGKYMQVGKILQQRNTKYIIVDHQLPPPYLQSFYYGGDSLKLLNDQGNSFQKIILGRKIKDFGSRYSLYSINPRFENNKLYLTESFSTFPKEFSNLSYKRLTSYSYDISITHLKKTEKLIFLDPYYQDWKLSLTSQNGSEQEYAANDNVVFGYANGWNIDPEKIKTQSGEGYYSANPDGSINITLRLYFAIQRYSFFAYALSGITFLISCCYILYFFIKPNKPVI